MKAVVLFLLLVFVINFSVVKAQQKIIDSLTTELIHSKPDTTRVLILDALVRLYYQFKPDTAIILGQEAYELAQELNYPAGESLSLNRIASSYSAVGDYVKCLQLLFKARKISEDLHDIKGIVRSINNIGDTYMVQGDFQRALPYFIQIKNIKNSYIDDYFHSIVLLNLGECYLHLNQLDSAQYYLQANYALVKNKKFEDLYGDYERDLGEVEAANQHGTEALAYFRKSISSYQAVGDIQHLSISYQNIARMYEKNKKEDSAIYYAQKALSTAQTGTNNQGILNASKMLADLYEINKNIPEAFRYHKIATAAKDSLFSQDKVKQILSISFEEKQRQQDLKAARIQYKNQVRMYALIAGLGILLLLAFILWRNSRQRQKANTLLQRQKEELLITLTELKTTQAQLIQSEKMASLGELTAGIAHEIQNPLNFVNNFSEVNKELLDEMLQEIHKGNFTEVEAIANDINENEQKISHHGKRADAIVKGMLQHSRSSTGQKEPININALTDEYLRLCYHGLRAKDKSFNAIMQTDFDETLGKINIVAQDIGRVFLNLFNNAFYSVNEKKKKLGDAYEPTVSVITKRLNNKVEIRVKDNGSGIPKQVLDKIYQPFFTTKPTGEGTGLGLSMSYDIITKEHGGTINAETKEGEFAEFIIQLPN